MITSNTGVPSLLANGTTGQVLTATTGSPPSWTTISTGNTALQSVKKTLTNAQLRAWNPTPIALVAAQGAGTIIMPVSLTMQLNYGGTSAFTGGGAGVFVYWGSGAAIWNMGTTWTQTATTFFFSGCPYITPPNIYNPATNVSNQALNISSNGNMTGNAANDNTISVYVTYFVLTL